MSGFTDIQASSPTEIDNFQFSMCMRLSERLARIQSTCFHFQFSFPLPSLFRLHNLVNISTTIKSRRIISRKKNRLLRKLPLLTFLASHIIFFCTLSIIHGKKRKRILIYFIRSKSLHRFQSLAGDVKHFYVPWHLTVK